MFIKCFFLNFDILILKIKKLSFFLYIFNKMEACYKSERAVLNLENKMRDLIVNIKIIQETRRAIK